MQKKVMIFVFVVIVLLGIILVRNFNGLAVIDQSGSGIVIFPSPPPTDDGTSDQTPSSLEGAAEAEIVAKTTDAEQATTSSEIGGACWQCPSDGVVLNLDNIGLTWAELSDLIVSTNTKCSNKTVLVSVICPAECNDGVDNDGDGLIDYPVDLGCAATSDNSEKNCGNGLCEISENETTCPEDCGVDNSIMQEGEKTSVTDTSAVDEGNVGAQEEGGDAAEAGGTTTYRNEGFYSVCTSVENFCVQRAIPEGARQTDYPDQCSTDTDCVERKQAGRIAFSPPEQSGVLKIMLRAMFGFE